MKSLSFEGEVPKIKAVMTPFPHFIEQRSTVAEAREMLAAQGIRHLPVQSSNELVGIVTDRSLRAATDPELLVSEVMSEDVFVVDMDRPLDVVLEHMTEERLDCALVRHQGKLAGIFTTFDACRLLGEALQRSGPPPSDGVA